jgi:preprotein translocase subunit SecG
MPVFYGIVLGIHVIICVCLVLVVLLQAARGGGLAGGGAFGGGAESTMFGGRGAATFLSKATTVFGAAFMVTSLALTLLGSSRMESPKSVVAEQAATLPVGPPTTAPGAGTVPGGAPSGTGNGSVPGVESGFEFPPPAGSEPAQGSTGGETSPVEGGAPEGGQEPVTQESQQGG